jgi:oxygen-independent coproporphyrinogen-3 oxidase
MNPTAMILPAATVARFDVGGPRYTSYPTADRFTPAFDAQAYRAALEQRAAAPAHRPLGLYVHLPFCASVCYYCACNKVVTRDRSRADEYLDVLLAEIELHARALGAPPPEAVKDLGSGPSILQAPGATVSQLHFGGGTPTFFDDAQLARLMDALQRAFTLAPGAERAIEIDPRTVDAQRLAHLASLGFDRLSFGVQDFDPMVQQAVHRVQPYEQVRALMLDARRIGFDSINVDLIYGLPKQTPQSVARTLAQVIELEPDRIALYAYAHLPERFKPQRRIAADDLPPPADRLQMLDAAIKSFLDAGYEYIGMDHFARRDDTLAVARRQGRLHRNFQGYSTQPDGDLIGLGVSAIGQIGPTYAQNAKTLPAYYEAVRSGRFATERGYTLNADDLLRRAVILSIMCQGQLRHAEIAASHGVDSRRYFAAELQRLQGLADEGLVVLDDEGLRVTPAGRFVLRAIAMVFDAHLRAPDRARFSRIV